MTFFSLFQLDLFNVRIQRIDYYIQCVQDILEIRGSQLILVKKAIFFHLFHELTGVANTLFSGFQINGSSVCVFFNALNKPLALKSVNYTREGAVVKVDRFCQLRQVHRAFAGDLVKAQHLGKRNMILFVEVLGIFVQKA